MSDERLYECPSPVGLLESEDGEKVKVRCGKPTCPFCGRIYKRKFLDDVHFGCDEIQKGGKRWRFLTVTTSYDSDQSLFSTYWNRFRALLFKHGYTHFDFVKVTEINENGLRHAHILISAFLPFNVIKAAWYLATDKTANRVNIKAVQLWSPAGYMAKYMTKNTGLSEKFRKGERRYTFSRHFPRLPKRPKDTSKKWTFKSKLTLMYEALENGTWYENDRIINEPLNPWWDMQPIAL